MTTTPTRADVLLNRVEHAWQTTGQIDEKLYAGGFRWGANISRNILHALTDMGLVQRQRAGAGYRWRLTPVAPIPLGQVPVSAADLNPVAATADDLAEVAKRIGDLASQLAAVQPAAPSKAAAVTVVVGDECDLFTLTEAQEYLAKRVVKRAVYDTGRALLDVLEGWIEGAAENNEAMGRSSDGMNDPEVFDVAEIRTMVNDACRVMGAPEAWHA